MANLKELKNRIGSVKNTQKITKAMKMVAASKLRRAQDKAEGTRPYSRKIQQIISNLSSSIESSNRPALMAGREGNRRLLIVTSADRGLCGGFNTSIIKAAKAEVSKLILQGDEVKIITVGKKAKEVLGYTHKQYIVKSLPAAKGKQVEFSEADEIGKLAIDMFEANEVDNVKIIFSKFINPLVQEVTNRSLIPLEINEVEANDNIPENKSADDNSSIYEYEPDEEAILKELLPQAISVQIFRAMLENSASEQGARMTAMDNATKNASEMIHKLTLQYNRSRQAAITTELTEIVAGAEAV